MMEYLRSHKFIGMAVFDLVGSMLVSGFIGRRFGADALFSSLISIPLSIVTHMVLGSDTELTRFYQSDSPHRYHGVYIGVMAGIVSKMTGYSTLASTNVGLATSIVSTLYMKEYAHNLPPKVNKLLLRYYMKYQRWN